MDVGGWDNSLCLNGPGQSGDPRSPHYADLAQIWASGDYVPMLYSKEKIDPTIYESTGITNLLRSPEGIAIKTLEEWNKKQIGRAHV